MANFDILRSNRMVPKLCRELPLIELMMPPKGILMIHSDGEARDHFVYKGISGGPTQLVAITRFAANLTFSRRNKIYELGKQTTALPMV